MSSKHSAINTAAPIKTHRKTHPFWRVIPWLRWLIAPYYFIVLLCAFYTVVIAGYGLAHGSDASNNAFYRLIIGAMLVGAIPPLSFLLRSQAIWVRVLQVISIVILAITLFLFSKIIFYLYIEPALWTKEFKAVTNPIAIKNVLETPILLNKTPIGLRVSVNVKLPKTIALDRFGAVVLDSLSSLTLFTPDLKGGNRMAPFADGQQAIVTFNGKPIDDLPGMKAYRAQTYGWVPDGQTQLPAGVYQVSQSFWLNGLRRPNLDDYANQAPTPCKIATQNQNPAVTIMTEQHLIETNNTPLAVQFSGRLSLRDRNGYRYFGRSAPIQYRYNHAQWANTLAALPLSACIILDAAKQAKEAEKTAIQKAQDDKIGYDNGHLFYKENPLYAEACAGDLLAINKRLGAEKNADGVWIPRFALSSIINECTVQKPNIAIFKQLVPSLFARSKLNLANGENEYCDVLGELHSYRNLPYLEALAALKLPLDCTVNSQQKEMWRKGFAPFKMGVAHDYNSNAEQNLILESAKRDDGVAWIKLLTDNNIDICIPETLSMSETGGANKKLAGKTLLDRVIRHHPPNMIAAVMAAGCDPQRAIKINNSSDILNFDDHLPASVWWLFRQHRYDGDFKTSAIQASSAILISQLNQQLSPKVAQLIAVPGYASIFVANRRIVDDSDTGLLAALAKADLPLNYSGDNGDGWFYPAYGNSWDNDATKRYTAMLDKLSNAQLKQLINPIIYTTNQPAKPMRGLAKPQYAGQTNPFRDYVCQRKAMVCH